MKTNVHQKTVKNSITSTHGFRLLGLAVLITLASLPALARDGFHYRQTNLVSDLPGAQVTDTNLVNAWGISFSTSGPFWISDNGTGQSTLYAVTNDSTGAPHVTVEGLVVTIPGDGSVTGQFFDGTGQFHGDVFIFVNEDGTISGWRGALGTAAEVLVSGSTNNVYKGVAISTNTNGTVLLAANFRQGTVDVYDTNLTLVSQLKDNRAANGYAPFNVQSLDGELFVTFAKQDADKHDDVGGRGHGLIDVLHLNTGKFSRFVTGRDAGGNLDEINSPWGLTVASRSFAPHSDELLVGNFGSGTIMTFNEFGHFHGLLEGAHGKPIVIDGLWGLTFGNGGNAGVPGDLYFTAGPQGESHGLFGSLTAAHGHGHGHGNDDGDGDNDRDDR